MTKRRDVFTPARVKPLFGAKRPLKIVERTLPTGEELVPTPRQAHLRVVAAERVHDQRLGVDSEHP